MEPLTLLAALGPLVVDLGRAVIGRFVGGDFKPSSVAEWLQMQQADTDRLKVINEAGGANPSYLWVEAVVRLMRPFVAAVVLGVWAYTRMSGLPSVEVDNFAAAVGFYLFGDRTLFYARGKNEFRAFLIA